MDAVSDLKKVAIDQFGVIFKRMQRGKPACIVDLVNIIHLINAGRKIDDFNKAYFQYISRNGL